MARDMSREERLKEAVDWHLRLQDSADDAAWVAFTAWLEADPANRVAFDGVEDIDAEIGNLLRTNPPVAVKPRIAPRSVFQCAPFAAAAAIAAVVLVALFVQRSPGSKATEYTTAAEEVKTLALADGSKIVLNARTSVSIDGAGREATLNHGEALFRIMHNPMHPFSVRAGDRIIRDIGTTFDVSRNSGMVRVVVAEGRIGVAPVGASDGISATNIAAGFAFSHSEGSNGTQISAVDAAEATAWQKGFLIYHNARLDEIVNDLNRFYATPIVISGDTGRRFSGVLKLDEENATLMRLAAFLQLKITRTADGKIGLQDTKAAP